MRRIISKFSKAIKRLKNKKRIVKLSLNNEIVIDENIQDNIKLDIFGVNNVIKLTNISIPSSDNRKYISIYVYGDNNEIIIDDISISNKLNIVMGNNHFNFGKVMFCTFKIGKNTTIEEMEYCTYNSHSYCDIGERCMISDDVILYNTDGHPVMNKESLEVINKVKGINVGNHCWIGKKVSILKNTVVPDNCILGFGSVVSGNLIEEYAAYAGNPAKCIKRGVTLDSNGSKFAYVDNVID